MKITFLGAGSTVFARNVLGDCLCSDLKDFDIALYDIDESRLNDSYNIICALRDKYKPGVTVEKYTDPREAFRGAKYIVNAIQVGGYKPCTVTDFEIPKKYGLRQTIADTLGIGGIFRALRTIPVLKAYTDIMEEVCPDVLLLNYTNPMAMITGYLQRYTKIKTIGLCHSVQVCTSVLGDRIEMPELKDANWFIAGINHMAWLLDVRDKDGNDLYPALKEQFHKVCPDRELVRRDIMDHFGYYNTESSEHSAEYHPYYIKEKYPELIDRFKIPLDEYLRRCESAIVEWATKRDELLGGKVEHTRTHEYASRIIEAIETDVPYRVHGNIINNGIIENLPPNACVEVPIMIDGNGMNPCHVGYLPEQLAALNRTNVNVQLMTIQAAHTLKKQDVYMAAYLDPHTKAELSLDDITAMCDDMFEAHKDWLPTYN